MKAIERNNKSIRPDGPRVEDRDGVRGFGRGIAPAVALLLLSDAATATADQEVFDEDSSNIPEPSALALLAAGAVVGGAAKYVRRKRPKK